MRLADGIRKHGFLKWYERELIHSHAHLLVLLMCAMGLMGVFELLTRTAPLAVHMGNVGLLVLCAGIGMWSLRRYLSMLMHAEAIASQAVCPECQTYGRLTVVHDDLKSNGPKVSCRRCRHEWQISESDSDSDSD